MGALGLLLTPLAAAISVCLRDHPEHLPLEDGAGVAGLDYALWAG
jgi:hypothetical protein